MTPRNENQRRLWIAALLALLVLAVVFGMQTGGVWAMFEEPRHVAR